MLAPLPDFRYVGLGPAPRALARGAVAVSASSFAVAASAALSSQHAVAAGAALLGGAVLAGVALRRGTKSDSAFCIVPWGVIIEPEGQTRVLRWPAVRRVQVDTQHGSDQGTPTTLFSTVLVETEREEWRGQAPGAVPLDQLVAYLPAYADEQSKPVALSLDGERSGPGPIEPECEALLAAARAYARSAEGASHLGLPPGGYRDMGALCASSRTVTVLGDVLRGREGKATDPRALAAVLAAELGASELTADLVRLVQCPHPVVAAVAKAAARRLGLPHSRTGTLDEVSPFLHGEDAELLSAWAG